MEGVGGEGGREIDINRSNAKHKDTNIFGKPSDPCHVGIHWIALAEYSKISTHVPGIQSFSALGVLGVSAQVWVQVQRGTY